MLWYGSYGTKNSVHYLKHKQYNYSKILLKAQLSVNISKKVTKQNFVYTLPHNWNLVLVRSKSKNVLYVLAYSKIYFLTIPVFTKINLFFYDKNTNQLTITLNYTNNFLILYLSLMTKFSQILIAPIFKKIKFKGKGYYIYKNYRNTITPQFGYSHRLYMYSFFNYVKFLNKTSLVCFGLTYDTTINVSRILLGWRPVNIFTGRGVRFSKQVIYKKSGKVSSYR
jgi:hypothetical protein